VPPIAFVHHPEAALAQDAVWVPVVGGRHELFVLDPLHERLLGRFIGIVGVLHGDYVAGIAWDVAYVQPNGPVQVEVDRQQANERKESYNDEQVKIIDVPFVTKYGFVYVDKRFRG